MASLVGMPSIEKLHFSQTLMFLIMDISLNTKDQDCNFEMCIYEIYMQVSLSQIFFFYFLLCPSIYLMKTRKLKPIFHCDAKLFALGTFVSHNASYQHVGIFCNDTNVR